MDADDHHVEVVLKEARRFMVPLYQRKYQWGDARLAPFWEDVSAKAAEVLEGECKFQHYMGALILAPVDLGSEIGRTPVVQVVDGQQRLTTFQIFLAALREVARKHKENDLIDHINGYLFNTPKSKDSDPLTRFKLTPTPSDRDLFHDLMELPFSKVFAKFYDKFWGGRIPKNTPLPALRAYYLFHSWIDAFVTKGPEADAELDLEGTSEEGNEQEEAAENPASTRLEALLKALLDSLKLVVITLEEGDDAQVIFETLNSKGEPLLAMDLVRNNIFHRAEKQQAPVEDLYKKLWDPLDGPWWREPAPNARPQRPRLDHFLAHVLTAETGENVSVRELYAEYRAFAVPKGKPKFEKIEDELTLLEKYTPLYATLEGREKADATLFWLGRKLATWQVTTAYPVAMQLGANGIDDGEKQALARLIYSYLARRALCGLSTKNLNKVFQSLASEFLKSGASLETFKNFFKDRTGPSTRFPDDDELRRGILGQNAYGIAPRTRLVDILWELEVAMRPRLAELVNQPEGLWIEHVMPQTWTAEWPFEDGVERQRDADDPLVIARNAQLQTLGNLTLMTDGLNISSGNASVELH